MMDSMANAPSLRSDGPKTAAHHKHPNRSGYETGMSGNPASVSNDHGDTQNQLHQAHHYGMSHSGSHPKPDQTHGSSTAPLSASTSSSSALNSSHCHGSSSSSNRHHHHHLPPGHHRPPHPHHSYHRHHHHPYYKAPPRGQFQQRPPMPPAPPRRHYSGTAPAPTHHGRSQSHISPVDPASNGATGPRASGSTLQHPPPNMPPQMSYPHPNATAQAHGHPPAPHHLHHHPSYTHPPLPPHHSLPQPPSRNHSHAVNSGSTNGAAPAPTQLQVNHAASQSRLMPLQTVVQNCNHQSPKKEKSFDDADRKILSATTGVKPAVVLSRPSISIGKGEENPASMDSEACQADPSSESEEDSVEPSPASGQKQPRINSALMMKSPVTLCFERMLGAAQYLAANPTPDVVKRQLKRKEADQIEDIVPVVEAIEAPASPLAPKPVPKTIEKAVVEEPAVVPTKRPKTETVVEEEAAVVPTKRTKTVVRSLPSSKGSRLEEGNPFLELEKDEELLHKVILQMALISESKETKRVVTEPVSHIIGEGFYWRDYPVLEEILFDNMKNYYNMSSQNRQSRHQQEFNNRLVSSIRDAATEHGFSFDPSFNDKRLRDRIRCFYKTHLQNAKKRLATLQKHPNSPIHQSHLRIYIRCVKENMSVEDSEALEPGGVVAPTIVVRKRNTTTEESIPEDPEGAEDLETET